MDFINLFESSGLANLQWQQAVLIAVGLGFVYLAITRGREPYVLLPIGLGIVITNLPETGLTQFDIGESGEQESGIFGIILHYGLSHWDLLPPLIFLGIGAMTDFGPVIANPKTLLLGAAAQIGIFVAFWGALATGLFDLGEAAAIGIIGGADGPTTIFLSAILAPEILGITAVVAYTYMASVVFIQPPLMKLLTTSAERSIVMKPLREVSRTEKVLFPVIAMIIIILVVPKSAPLISMFMMGNLFRQSGVVPRLADAASNELLNLATIFLMLTVGTQLTAVRVFDIHTIVILALGIVAFSCGTVGGLLFAKFMNLFLKDKINPLIGSAGVSAVPMAARISHQIGQEADSGNYLLSHAMGPNVAGVIGSAVVAGVFISLVEGVI
jgi:sodium ion-translocating decarboxylase beta subunit